MTNRFLIDCLMTKRKIESVTFLPKDITTFYDSLCKQLHLLKEFLQALPLSLQQKVSNDDPELCSSFGVPTFNEFSATPVAYQILVAINIIAKLSYWMGPVRRRRQLFEHFIRDGLVEFRTAGYVDKVKACITPESLPSNHEELLAFLYHQITNIAVYIHNHFISIMKPLHALEVQIIGIHPETFYFQNRYSTNWSAITYSTILWTPFTHIHNHIQGKAYEK
ncbi:hypothetical protein F5887DRAFT_926290 [Amanita rubescens]|nr:hypothetical protein F5887DRAFT_926290 [Amanita rubescens]